MPFPELTDLLDKIEAELRRLRLFVEPTQPVPPTTSAFGMGQTSFEQWLVHVFLPNARKAVAASDLPESSQVAVAAYHNFDGMDEAETLVGLLHSFDERINLLGRSHRSQRK